MFLIWEGIYKYIIQIFKSLNKELMAKDKLKILQQTALAIIYLTKF